MTPTQPPLPPPLEAAIAKLEAKADKATVRALTQGCESGAYRIADEAVWDARDDLRLAITDYAAARVAEAIKPGDSADILDEATVKYVMETYGVERVTVQAVCNLIATVNKFGFPKTTFAALLSAIAADKAAAVEAGVAELEAVAARWKRAFEDAKSLAGLAIATQQESA